MSKYFGVSAYDLGRAIDQGTLDPVELSEAYLSAIAENPHSDRIYTMATPDRARAEARAAKERAKSGFRLSPLDGVPLSWKDLFDTAGHETEAGTALLKGRVPEQDAKCLQAATAAGLVCIGKTHMSELAFSGLGLNPVTATAPNVNFEHAVPGGSSSGAAASVAFELAPAAIGSDTGGSVRIPAAWNDLVGLKTTAGLVSLEGVVPLCARFDTVGPLSKTVEDAAYLHAALLGQGPFDLKGASLSDFKLAILKDDILSETREAPGAAFEDSVARLSRKGAHLSEVSIGFLSHATSQSSILFNSEAYGTWKTEIEAAPEVMFHEILTRFRGGAEVKAADFVAEWQNLERLRKVYQELTRGFDAVLCPTAPILPPNAERLLTDNDYYMTENLLALRHTRIANLMGLCATTLPTGDASCGLMALAAPLQERNLLRLSYALEAALS